MSDVAIGVLILILAAFSLLGGICMLIKRKRVLYKWAVTEAKVIEHLYTREEDDDHPAEYKFKISYTVNGEVIENVIKGSREYVVGGTFEIKYDPSSPKNFEANVDISQAYIGAAVIAFLFAAGFAYFAITDYLWL